MIKRKHKILIVDDVSENIKLIATILEKEHFEIGIAQNGISTLSIIKNQLFDIILLDVMLPDISGFDLCRKIKKISDYEHVPIIFLTAKTDESSIVKGFEVGGVDYITKPFNQAELIMRVRNHIKLLDYRKRLENSNEELLSFASRIAHDLKSPLVSIISTLNVIRVSDYNNLNEENKYFINESIQKARSMTTVIDDILSYSQIEQHLRFEECNLQNIIESSLQMIDKDIKEINAKVFYNNNLSEIYGNQSLLSVLFQNLINNSIKYCKTTPEIIISVTEKDKEWEFSITDNGIGIEPKYKDKIFNMFSRIENNINYKGTGIGLATCKKIVEAHGGKIWFESEINKGTTFYFTISKNDIHR